MIKYSWKILVVLMVVFAFTSCERINIDDPSTEWDETLDPEVEIDSTGIQLRSAGQEFTYTTGTALVEDYEGKVFVSIVVKVNNEFEEPAFLMAWESDELVEGTYEGLEAAFVLPDPSTGEIGNFFLQSGSISRIGDFEVTIQQIDTEKNKLVGFFKGFGKFSNGNSEKYDFEGSFSLDLEN